jgi:hypothetical protein
MARRLRPADWRLVRARNLGLGRLKKTLFETISTAGTGADNDIGNV